MYGMNIDKLGPGDSKYKRLQIDKQAETSAKIVCRTEKDNNGCCAEICQSVSPSICQRQHRSTTLAERERERGRERGERERERER